MGDKSVKDYPMRPNLHPELPLLDPSGDAAAAAATAMATHVTQLPAADDTPAAVPVPAPAPAPAHVRALPPTTFETDIGISVRFSRESTSIGADWATRSNAARISNLPGWHDVVLHGGPDGFAAGIAGAGDVPDLFLNHSSREVAEIIARNPQWSGQPIRLLACEAALHPDMAQAIANHLGVAVIASPFMVGMPSATAVGRPWQAFTRTDGTRSMLAPIAGHGQEWLLAEPQRGSAVIPAAQAVERPHYLDVARAALDFDDAVTHPGVPVPTVGTVEAVEANAAEALLRTSAAATESVGARLAGAVIGDGATGAFNLICIAQDIAAAVNGIEPEELSAALRTLPTIDAAQWAAAHPEAVAAAIAGSPSHAAYAEFHVVVARDNPSALGDHLPQRWHVVEVSPATTTGQLHERAQFDQPTTVLELTVSVPLNPAAVHDLYVARHGEQDATHAADVAATHVAPETITDHLARALGLADPDVTREVGAAMHAPLQSLGDAVVNAAPAIATAAQGSATGGVWARYQVVLVRYVMDSGFPDHLRVIGDWTSAGPVEPPTFVAQPYEHSEITRDAQGERMVVTLSVPVNDEAGNVGAGMPTHPMTDSVPAAVHALYTDEHGWHREPTETELEDYQHKADDDSDDGKAGVGPASLAGPHDGGTGPQDGPSFHDALDQPVHNDETTQHDEPTHDEPTHDEPPPDATTTPDAALTGTHQSPAPLDHGDATQQGATTVHAPVAAVHVVVDPAHHAPSTAEHDVTSAAATTTSHQPVLTHDPSTTPAPQHQAVAAHVATQPQTHVAVVAPVHHVEHHDDGSNYG